METRWKVVGVVVVAAIVGFLFEAKSPLGAAVWGSGPEDSAEPTGSQLPFLIFVGLLEAVAFGIGVAFLVFGWAYLRSAPVTRNVAIGAYAAIGWGLLSWVPHSAMHQTNGDNFWRLIVIEYAFHVTLIVAAVALAWFFVQVIRGSQPVMKKVEARPLVTAMR